MFGQHWLQLIALALIALLVFGPKRMIEMGSSMGKALREFRESTKDLNMSSLLSGESSDESPSALSRMSQVSQTLRGEDTATTPPAAVATPAATSVAPHVAEASVSSASATHTVPVVPVMTNTAPAPTTPNAFVVESTIE